MPADNLIATPPDSFDEPWKLILERSLRDFLAFLFTPVAAAIDWSRPPEPLPTELTRLTGSSSTGTRYLDWLESVAAGWHRTLAADPHRNPEPARSGVSLPASDVPLPTADHL